jgi:hypothetical protein
VAQRVPGGLGSQISMIFGTWRWWGCQPHAPAAFTPRRCSWYSFSLGPWIGRKEYVTEKSSDTTGNRSRHRPTSSATPGPTCFIIHRRNLRQEWQFWRRKQNNNLLFSRVTSTFHHKFASEPD